MKITILLIVLLLLRFEFAWSADTTRAYCGGCDILQDVTTGYEKQYYPNWGGCEKLPLNCYPECIDGDLYRICEDGDTDILSELYNKPDSGRAFRAYISRGLSDTIQVCDTIWIFKADSISIWEQPIPFQPIGYAHVFIYIDSIICRDSVVVRE